MQTHAKVVIIGGGMMGAGLAYHLAEEGWTDPMVLRTLMLIERRQRDRFAIAHDVIKHQAFRDIGIVRYGVKISAGVLGNSR